LAAAPSAAAAAPSAAPVAAPSPADVFICRPTDRSSPPPPSAQAIKDAAAQEAHLSEAEDIAGSVNLSGGHRDINLDATTNLDLSPSSSAKKKKKAMSKKPLPASNASTHQVVEYYKQNETQQSPMPTDDVLLMKLTRELETHSSTPFHLCRTSRGERMTKCNCLRVLLFDKETETFCSNMVMAVANYALAHFKLHKMQQDQCFIDLYKMSLHITGQNNTNFFAVPFNNWHPFTQEKISNFSQADINSCRSTASVQVLCSLSCRGDPITILNKKVSFGVWCS
jgi:hypothetical protein